MFLRSILDILWTRRLIVLLTVACCLAGGGLAIISSPPRYQATARVVLEVMKPDPVTGAVVDSKEFEAYINSQVRMVRDYQVAIPAADSLGLLDNIELQTTFGSIPGADPSEFPQWVARRIIASTNAIPFEDSNILEIRHVSSTPALALQMVDAVRAAYIQASIDATRQGAAGGAEALANQAQQLTTKMAELEAAKAAIDQKNGGMTMSEAGRLYELVTTIKRAPVIGGAEIPSARRLAEADAVLAEAQKTLGPNHPRLVELRSARDILKAQVDRDRTSAGSFAESVNLAERSRQAAIDAQKDKVLSERPVALQLRLLQDEIDGIRAVLEEINTQIGGLRQLSSVQAVALTPMGSPEVRQDPVFPNPWLILGGTGGLGLVMGILLAVATELMNRRLRTENDLEVLAGAVLLGIVPQAASRERKARLRVRDRKVAPRPRDRLKTAA